MWNKSIALVLISSSFLFGCSTGEESTEVDSSTEVACTLSLDGEWRAVLTSPGGELPFGLRFATEGEGLAAVVLNGAEEAPVSGVNCSGDEVVVHFAWYDSEITAASAGDEVLEGQWRRTSPGGEDTVMAFRANRDADVRFRAVDGSGEGSGGPAMAVESVHGEWAVLFVDEDGEEEAVGDFSQGPSGEVEGTFLTPVGDYRFLAGDFGEGRLRLSTFDGAHAFLFQAQVQADGTLAGDFWSRDSYHATWTAHTVGEAEEVLPDPWEMAHLTNDEGLFRFEFPDTEGQLVAHDDPRFENKVLLVNIFGTWCPNCNDEAPHLAEWHRRYRDEGFEIVGLAYEFTGDPDRDREMLRRFADRHGIEYPLLLAGTSDKQDAAATLPDLSAVIAYPTSLFIGRDGKVRKIHTGFSGPGTGAKYGALLAELEGTIEKLLAQPVGS